MPKNNHAAGPLAPIPGRNAVLAALQAGRGFAEVLVDAHARPDPKLEAIAAQCRARGIAQREVPRADLERLCPGLPHQGVVGMALPRPAVTLEQILARCAREGRDPCLLLLRRVAFEQNLAAVLRTGDACGVDAVVVPSKQGAGVSANVARVSMGASEHVPVIRQSLLAAAAVLRRTGVRLVAAEAGAGEPLWEADLTGPLALVLGGEHEGVSDPLLARCDQVVSIPMRGHVNSLNVSVACGMLLYERLRQTEKGR